MTNKNFSNKLIFFGSSSFGLPTLESLLKNNYEISLVITLPDEPAGRHRQLQPTSVKIFCQKNNLSFIQPEKLKSQEIIKEIRDLKSNFAVVASYGKIIPKEILNIFPLGCLNLHPSLLPKYRGPSPIQTAILNGDKETGVTIIKLDEQMDHGPIIKNHQVPITNNQTYLSLHNLLSEEAAKLLIEILPNYLARKLMLTPQDDSEATYTKILTKEDGRIDWSKDAKEIERQIRAFYPWPGSFTEIKLKNRKELRCKILSARVAEEITVVEGLASANDSQPAESEPSATNVTIGKFQQKNGQIFVRCGEGSLIIEQIQPEGKKIMSADEFVNGYLN